MAQDQYKAIDVGASELSFTADCRRRTFPRVPLPPAFMEWVIEGRRAMYGLLEREGDASFFGAHLPVVVTYCRHEPIPFNTGNKGVGLLPVAGKIEHYCNLYQETLERCRKVPWEEGLPLRLDAVRCFVGGNDVSNEALITLEIFEKKTFGNLCDFPVATLHYAGGGPVYRSFQVNTIVQILPPGHRAFRFAFLSRQLFEHDRFHITQTKFPFAYLFHPVEVREKTPYPRKEERCTEAQRIQGEWSPRTFTNS